MIRGRGRSGLVWGVLGLGSIIGLPAAGILWVGYTPCVSEHDVATKTARILLPSGFVLGVVLASVSLCLSVASIHGGRRRGAVSAMAVALAVFVIAVAYGHGLLHPTDGCG